MKYCEICNLLSDSESCPVCGNEKLREVAPDDFCFLTECWQASGDALRDALQNKGVECALLPWGNGARSAFGLRLEKYRVYVPYKDYEIAAELFDLISGGTASNELRKELLQNVDKWHVVGDATLKKIRKKLKISENADVFEGIKEFVIKAESIEDRGMILCGTRQVRGVTAEKGKIVLWFSFEDFEIFI